MKREKGKTLIGKVVSTKTAKTATVAVERLWAHPLYEKRIKRSRKYHAHDEIGAKVGDAVRLRETRPISKTKKWQVIEVIKK